MSAPAIVTHEIVAGPEDAAKRLDQVLAARLDGLSRSRLQALIRQGQLAKGGATIVDPSQRVNEGDRYVLQVPDAAPAAPAPQAISLNIVYEDDDVIVIDKPANLVVHPGAGNADGTLVNALLAHCGDSLSGIGGVKRPGIVHRLDKNTSGLLVVAKNDRAHQALSAQFAAHGRDGALERLYAALVWGVPANAYGTIDAPIGRSPHNRLKQAVVKSGGREAVTHYQVERAFCDTTGAPVAALVSCMLETGRTHQVRVHMAHIGYPLMGDPLYARGFETRANRLDEEARAALQALGRQALHARRLAFNHPATGDHMEFDSALPADMARLADALAR